MQEKVATIASLKHEPPGDADVARKAFAEAREILGSSFSRGRGRPRVRERAEVGRREVEAEVVADTEAAKRRT